MRTLMRDVTTGRELTACDRCRWERYALKLDGHLDPVRPSRAPCRYCGRGRWPRFGGPVEILVAAMAVGVALLASCSDRDRSGPVVIVDPGPPFPCRGHARRCRLDDGSTLVLVTPCHGHVGETIH